MLISAMELTNKIIYIRWPVMKYTVSFQVKIQLDQKKKKILVL